MGRSRRKRASSASKRADALCARLKPHIVEMIEKNDPAVAGLDFNRIEANSAAVGDLLAKASMLEALAAQPPPTDAEIARAREEALKKAALHYDEYATLLLFYFLNATVTSLRDLWKLTDFERSRRKLGVKRTSLGSLSEASQVFDPGTVRTAVGDPTFRPNSSSCSASIDGRPEVGLLQVSSRL